MHSDIKVLQAMRQLLDHPAKWTQGASARDGDANPTHPTAAHARSFDLIGAHRRYAPAKPFPPAIWQALRELGYKFVTQFNDAGGRAHGDIVLLLDRAIELARGAAS